MELNGRLQAAGEIESFDAVLLDAHIGDVRGLTGEGIALQLGAFREGAERLT